MEIYPVHQTLTGKAANGRVKFATKPIKEVISAPRSPWQNPFVERMIGSIRRECTDHVRVLNEAHLTSVLCSYFEYYHKDRTHLSLEKDPPDSRPIQSRPAGKCKIIDIPRIGGLHHRYEWKKAA